MGAVSHNLLGVMLGTASLCLLPGITLAGPEGGVVTGGSASIAGQGSANVVINQTSQRVVIDWNSFDIGANESATFHQPNSSSIALNRINNGNPTQILGNLSANGK